MTDDADWTQNNNLMLKIDMGENLPAYKGHEGPEGE
jgi:hypothetical protein